jgi:hypothetical protein
MTDPFTAALAQVARTAWQFRDPPAELAVLAGLVRWPAVVAAPLRELDLDAGDFSIDRHVRLYRAACHAAARVGPGGTACLLDVYAAARRDIADGDTPGGSLARWLVDVWTCHHWPEDLVWLWRPGLDDMPTQAAVAVVMAEKVIRLSKQRELIHRSAYAAKAAFDGIIYNPE